MHGNLEYRITIAGPVAIAPFVDIGTDPILRTSQLQINPTQYHSLLSTYFGCPQLSPLTAARAGRPSPIFAISPAGAGNKLGSAHVDGTRVAEMLPVINAPFRIYYAYNALRLDSSACRPSRSRPACSRTGGAGATTLTTRRAATLSSHRIRCCEPRKTFRFTVATTF